MGFFDNIEKWTDNVADKIEDGVKWGVTQGEDTVKSAESSITGIISTPLLILSIGLGFLLYNSNIGQVAETSKNVAPLFM